MDKIDRHFGLLMLGGARIRSWDFTVFPSCTIKKRLYYFVSVYHEKGRKLTPEHTKEVEEKVCEIVPRNLGQAVEEKHECAKIAQEISTVYFDGKPFDSSELNYIHVSIRTLLSITTVIFGYRDFSIGCSDMANSNISLRFISYAATYLSFLGCI